MAIENEEQFRAWLDAQPQEVCVAIACRAALRVLPFATRFPERHETLDRLALRTMRAIFTSGVAAVYPIREVKSASAASARAASVAHSTTAASATARTASLAHAAVNAGFAAAHDTDASVYAARAIARAAASVYAARASASASNPAFASARAAIYADADLPPETLTSNAVSVPDALREAIATASDGMVDVLASGGAWRFWAKWYAGAMAGEPLPWGLQKAVALIPEDIWDAGPEAVAEEIARIEDEFWAQALPQAETLVVVADGRFDVRPDPTPDDQRTEKMLGQVEFALDLALRTNSGFNEMCVAFKYLRYTLDDCRDDPNAMEQHFRQARDILRRKLREGEYDPDDALSALVDGLDQHALQLRGSHPEVGAAYEIRVKQRLREVDDATMKLVAGGMRAFQRDRTAGRLYEDTGLDAETVEQDSGIEAKATAIQRTGGRATQANII
ncbi:MAG: hypothetical protein JJ938_07795 [Roseicyclus sp.]|nr:hypothetical protein [Roseicyclus sp.]MBO6624767.1 hypothetical protein [Roseicyclus sp.]MBO6921487.1 hypothetical protein [Roseicyclus sp.]